ncbi:MAG: hypothetical protein EXR68_04480 [Dehalococcoidia bacterium]|nr:hypothetical protein [Dehalococcoidia bacterium]
MSSNAHGDSDLDTTPAWHAPAGAVDAHFHVFGPYDRYPLGAGLRWPVPDAPLDAFLALASHLGMERFVFVQPSGYGQDNGAMLDAMQRVGVDRCRGIVDIPEEIADAELDRLHALGVRGVRINVSPTAPYESGLAERLAPRVERLDARLAERGWHLDYLAPSWLVREWMPLMRRLRAPYTIAHFAMFRAADSAGQPGFPELLDLLRNGDGRLWVKLSGAYRISSAPGFEDAAPLARALIEARPDRLIWGTDYPHLSFPDVSSVELFNLLGAWAPDEATRQQILVTNPEELFGFQ